MDDPGNVRHIIATLKRPSGPTGEAKGANANAYSPDGDAAAVVAALEEKHGVDDALRSVVQGVYWSVVQGVYCSWCREYTGQWCREYTGQWCREYTATTSDSVRFSPIQSDSVRLIPIPPSVSCSCVDALNTPRDTNFRRLASASRLRPLPLVY